MAVNEGLTIFNLVDGVVTNLIVRVVLIQVKTLMHLTNPASDFYQNLSPALVVMVHLGVDAVTFENPEHAPLVTVTSQRSNIWCIWNSR